ncbi:hypothetical protein SISNIDRAFT_469674 [Sistotremastrum niveocremeum HHB9708]|uniref:Uncharacterized protein n=1 Tax=Sistotremastrum niveocremeum HHB9708 TaxID=1314777 RepID=A0A164PRC7_9AGAM|nr:hypothetical protein SISNIDRAFT_469674 [Sistotremastrum niveocremeum HHB9708]
MKVPFVLLCLAAVAAAQVCDFFPSSRTAASRVVKPILVTTNVNLRVLALSTAKLISGFRATLMIKAIAWRVVELVLSTVEDWEFGGDHEMDVVLHERVVPQIVKSHSQMSSHDPQSAVSSFNRGLHPNLVAATRDKYR